MEGSNDGGPQSSVKYENIVESRSEVFSKLQILDVDDLLTRIEKVYELIIQESTDPTSIYGNLVSIPLQDSKSTGDAINYRQEAERMWEKKNRTEATNCTEAILAITKSIARAEKDSEELAAAYSRRSYFSSELSRHDRCLQDVNRALHIIDIRKGPAGLKKELERRQTLCTNIQEDIMKIVTRKEEDLMHSEWRKSCNLKPSHTSLPNTSPKLKVHFDEKQERFLIATEDIQPGEILSIDDFYCTVLSLPKCYTNCAFCLLECDTMIPCFTCTQEMYCSENCRSRASDLYHQFECRFIKLFKNDTKSYTTVTRMAIRMFLLGTEQGKQLENLMEKVKPRDIFVGKCGNDFRFNDYRSILQIRRIGWFHDDHVYIAVTIIIGLLRSSFFGDFDTLPDRLSSVQSYAALLLINHLQTLGMVQPAVEKIDLRTYAVDSSVIPPEMIPEAKYFESHDIGLGLCVLQNSLIRRSLYANTSTFIQDRQRVVFATRKIQSGEKLSTIKSAMYKVPWWTEKYRRALLEKPSTYEIDECFENPPKLEILKDAAITFSSAFHSSFKTKFIALAEKKRTEVERAKELLSNQEILKLTIEHCNLLCEMLRVPSYDIVLCEQLLLVFMRVLYCDHQRPDRHLFLEGYFDDIIGFIANRYHLR